MKCQARGQIELVFSAGGSWGRHCSSQTREMLTEEGRRFGLSQENEFRFILN